MQRTNWAKERRRTETLFWPQVASTMQSLGKPELGLFTNVLFPSCQDSLFSNFGCWLVLLCFYEVWSNFWYLALVHGWTKISNSVIFLLLNSFCFASFFWWKRIKGKKKKRRERGRKGKRKQRGKGGSTAVTESLAILSGLVWFG